MSLIDHQQAVVEAGAKALADDWNPDREPVLTAMFSDYSATALTAATPHLRAETVDQLKNFHNDYQYTYAIPGDPYAEGYLTACKAIIALLEGGAE